MIRNDLDLKGEPEIQPAPSPCFVCGAALDYAANDEAFYTVPHAGTQFTSVGHYGSTVYDPNFGSIDEWLEINICDACLVERGGRIVRCIPSTRPPAPSPARYPWRL